MRTNPQGPARRALAPRARLRALLQRLRDTTTRPVRRHLQASARARRERASARAQRRAHRPRAAAALHASTARRYTGFAGDTLASALLANGVHLVGRSFKYHRPRGILTAGAEEPNALVTRARATRRAATPNLRATQVELYDGLDARIARTAGRSLGFDLGARERLCCRRSFPPASTTRPSCGRASFWARVYEPLIRRAAGLGRAPRAARSRSLRAALRALRCAGRRRRAGGPRGGARRVRDRRARDPVRRAGRAGRLAARRMPRRASTASRPRLAQWSFAALAAVRACAAAAHDRVRLLPAQHHRPRRAAHRSSGEPDPDAAARAAVAGARERGRARDRRHRAAAGVPRQRPARHHAGRRGADLSRSLRRARRAARSRRHDDDSAYRTALDLAKARASASPRSSTSGASADGAAADAARVAGIEVATRRSRARHARR